MRKKGSIIIILDSEGLSVKNFLYMLSKYHGIENYELILAYEKNEEMYFRNLIEECMINQEIWFYEAADISCRGMIYNLASELAHTDIFIFMDTNIVLKENCLDELVYSLIEEDVLAVQPMVIQFRTPLIQSTGYVFSEKSAGHALQNRNVEEEIVNQSYKRSALVTSIMAINRFAFEELHGFDSTVPCELMGREITMRITMKGYKNYYNHRAGAYYMANENRGNEYGKGVDLKYEKLGFKIKNQFHEMEELVKRQMSRVQLSKSYVIINFSGIVQIQEVMRGINLKVSRIINCSGYSENGSIEFEHVLPFSLVEEHCEYIYFANNFCQVKNNPVWFGKRENYEDLIVDLSGNVLRISEII